MNINFDKLKLTMYIGSGVIIIILTIILITIFGILIYKYRLKGAAWTALAKIDPKKILK